MRFLRSLALCALASAPLLGVSATLYQIDATGDNTFELFVARSDGVHSLNSQFVTSSGVASSSTGDVNQPRQLDWRTPSRYTNVELEDGDVISVYVHNDDGGAPSTNPSAFVARIRELAAGGGVNNFEPSGREFVTDNIRWSCAWRHETESSHLSYDKTRLTGNADDWAAKTLTTTSWSVIGGQTGSTSFGQAIALAQVGATSIWHTNGDADIKTGLGVTTVDPTTPYWIYGNDQFHSGAALAHHGWCRFTVPSIRNLTPGGNGDPVFSGFQGQVFQFHGLPDEHFNLISSPAVQLNAHFVYLSSGTCNYNDTACWTHPGTYMDVLGFSIGDTRVKLVAGTHEAGLRVWVNDMELQRGARNFSLSDKTQASIKYHRHGKVQIHTELMDFEVANSDMFMNVNVALLNQELLRVGSKKHTITDKNLCMHNEETYDHALVESKVSAKYPITTPMHGLIGQTWRNLKVCGREWMGTVQDYVTSSLFGTDYHYNYYKF